MTTQETTPSNKRPTKPDQVAFNKETEAIKTEIERLQKELAQIQEQIPSKDSKSGGNSKRSEARAKLDALLEKRKELNDKHTKTLDEIKSLQATIKKKLDENKASKDKIGFKTPAEIDARIASIERELESGQAKLIEEKRMVAEISNLKKSKKALEAMSSQRNTVEDDKAKLDKLRADLKESGSARDEIRGQLDAARAELTAIDAELQVSRGSVTSLLEKKKALKVQIDGEYDKLRELRTNYKAAQDAWYAHQRAEAEKRKEALLAKKKEEKEARILAQAQKELELADIPAFSDEIALCTALVKFLQSAAGEKPASETNAVKPNSTASAAPRNEQPLPAGATLLPRKGEQEEEVFMCMGGGKKKKGKRGGNASSGSSNRPLKLDFEIIDQFAKLKINIPVSVGDIPNAITKLEEKKKELTEAQPKQTEANKAAARARVAQLREAAEAQENAEAAVTEA